jgi:3-dehydroquinate synthetase
MDKKREGDLIYFVLLNEIGNAYVEEIAIQELQELIDG